MKTFFKITTKLSDEAKTCENDDLFVVAPPSSTQIWDHHCEGKSFSSNYINYSFYIDITNSWWSRWNFWLPSNIAEKREKAFFIIILIVLQLYEPSIAPFHSLFWFTTSNGSCRIESLISQMDFTFPLLSHIFYKDKFSDCNMLCNWIISNYEDFRVNGFTFWPLQNHIADPGKQIGKVIMKGLGVEWEVR